MFLLDLYTAETNIYHLLIFHELNDFTHHRSQYLSLACIPGELFLKDFVTREMVHFSFHPEPLNPTQYQTDTWGLKSVHFFRLLFHDPYYSNILPLLK